jgi:uncharacterized protein
MAAREEQGVKGRLSLVLLALSVVAIAALTGCATYSQQNHFAGSWAHGDLAAAEKEATLKADKEAGGKDAIIWRLEQASILRAQGRYAESNKAFDEAQEKIDAYAEGTKVKLGAETAAMFSNLANLPYRGRAYDGIMLNTYKALNFLALHDLDKARVEIIRAYQRQQDAVEENKRRLQKAQDELEAEKEKQRIEQARNDPNVKGRLDQTYSRIDTLQVYSDYVNPFTVYLDGLIYFAGATSASDLEHARKSFERVGAFVEHNRCVQEDLAMVEAATQGRQPDPFTYIIVETGRAPVRDQIRIDIPILISKLSYVGASFPTLEPQRGQLSALNVMANGTNQAAEVLASMDSIIAQDFKSELPIVITKTIAAAVIKAAASYAANDAANKKGDELAGLFSQIGTAMFQIAVNIADLRTWTTLPKEFLVCRVPTPVDRKIELQTPGSAQKVTVTLDEGVMNLVFVKSISAGGPLFVSQMKLK